MLIRLDFIKLETGHLVFFLGAGAVFYQQLKLDIFRDFSESIYFLPIKSFLQSLIAPIHLNIN